MDKEEHNKNSNGHHIMSVRHDANNNIDAIHLQISDIWYIFKNTIEYGRVTQVLVLIK